MRNSKKTFFVLLCIAAVAALAVGFVRLHMERTYMETALPADFNVHGSVDGAVSSATGKNAQSGFSLVLNIATFNNYTNEDIQQLTNEIMVTAGQFAKRKGVVFA